MAASDFNSVGALCKTLDLRQSPIARTCSEISACLAASRDNYRPFFEQAFPKLLGRIFGFNGVCWLAHISNRGAVADVHALLELLSPTGIMFAAMHAVDADRLVKFEFPSARLPTHTQVLLATSVGRQELSTWPQYSDDAINADAGGRAQVHLTVLCYFWAWFAFYVLRGGLAAQDSRPPQLSESPATGIAESMFKAAGTLGLPLRPSSSAPSSKPLMDLLQSYLKHFLPQQAPGVSSSHSFGVSARGGRGAGETLYSVLVEWWLTDGEEPQAIPAGMTPTHIADTASLASVPNSLRSLSYEAPSDETLEALALLVRHAVVSDGSGSGPPSPAQVASPWLPQPPVVVSPPHLTGITPRLPPAILGAAGSSSAQALSRRMYRLLKRALSMWPQQRPLLPLFKLWLTLMAPWRDPAYTPPQHGVPGGEHPGGTHGVKEQLSRAASVMLPDSMQPPSSRSPVPPGHDRSVSGGAAAAAYDPRLWQSHVLAHLPLSGVLVPLAAEAVSSRCSRRPHESAVCMLQVVDVFSSAPELVRLLEAVETEAARFATLNGSHAATWNMPRYRPEGAFAELLPWVADQVADWEAAASADGLPAPSHPDTIPPQLSMLAVDARGTAPWLAALLRTAESASLPTSLIYTLREAAQKVFPLDRVVVANEQEALDTCPPAGLEHIKAVRQGKWNDVRYRGDPLRRPIASYEVPVVARLAVRASEAINRKLQLDTPVVEGESLPSGFLQTALLAVRRRRWRVNLRPVAEWRTLAFVITLWLLLRWILWPLLRLLYLVMSTSSEEEVPEI